MKFFRSKGYKVISSLIYGWGASCVIIGALFKIMHFPGAGWVLTIGMLIEAFIFFFSAFEPVMEQYDWTRVFPQLGRKAVREEKEREVENISFSTKMEALDAGDIQELKKGIRKFVDTMEAMSTIGDYVPGFTQKMGKISAAFENLQNQTEQVSCLMENSMKELSIGCHEINHSIADLSKRMTEELKNNCDRIQNGTIQVTGQFTNLEKVLAHQVQDIKLNSEVYTKIMNEINQNLTALSELYQNQIQENKSTIGNFCVLNQDLSQVCQQIAASTTSTKQFKAESQQLSERVSALNSVYANMLSLVDNN